MDYCVQFVFDNVNVLELNGYGVDYVVVVEGFGCKVLCVFKLEEIELVLCQVQMFVEEFSVLVVVEVIFECVMNILMGIEIDVINEFEDFVEKVEYVLIVILMFD